MIGIGINENVYLGKPTTDEKSGVLIISFKEPVAGEAELKEAMTANPFADWEDGGSLSHTEGGNGISLRMFPFDSKSPVSEPDKVIDGIEMKNRISQLRDPLVHILSQYMTNDKIIFSPAIIFKGTGIDKDVSAYGTKILSDTVQEKVYNNIVNQFIALATPFIENPELLFRLKLPRQSAKKAYATIPSRYLKDSPFMEPMSIPKAASKIKFSAWEIKNGFDNADPVSVTTADVKEAEPENDPFANQ